MTTTVFNLENVGKQCDYDTEGPCQFPGVKAVLQYTHCPRNLRKQFELLLAWLGERIHSTEKLLGFQQEVRCSSRTLKLPELEKAPRGAFSRNTDELLSVT